MFNMKELKKIKGFTSEIVDTNKITTKYFVKKLRNDLNLSQKLFAEILGISEKTVEKWEQGKNPVKGASSKLLYLLSKDKNLINELYKINGVLTEEDLNAVNKSIETVINEKNYIFNYSIKDSVDMITLRKRHLVNERVAILSNEKKGYCISI